MEIKLGSLNINVSGNITLTVKGLESLISNQPIEPTKKSKEAAINISDVDRDLLMKAAHKFVLESSDLVENINNTFKGSDSLDEEVEYFPASDQVTKALLEFPKKETNNITEQKCDVLEGEGIVLDHITFDRNLPDHQMRLSYKLFIILFKELLAEKLIDMMHWSTIDDAIRCVDSNFDHCSSFFYDLMKNIIKESDPTITFIKDEDNKMIWHINEIDLSSDVHLVMHANRFHKLCLRSKEVESYCEGENVKLNYLTMKYHKTVKDNIYIDDIF